MVLKTLVFAAHMPGIVAFTFEGFLTKFARILFVVFEVHFTAMAVEFASMVEVLVAKCALKSL